MSPAEVLTKRCKFRAIIWHLTTVPEPFPKPLRSIWLDRRSDGKGVELRGVEPLASRVRF